jgi:hypothetical protein
MERRERAGRDSLLISGLLKRVKRDWMSTDSSLVLR